MVGRNEDFYDEYAYFLEAQKGRRNTLIGYITDTKQFLEYLNVDATKAKFKDANEWLNSLKNKSGLPIAASTWNRKLASLNHFYDKYMIKSGYAEINPFRMITPVEIIKGNDEESNQIVRDFLTIEETDRFKKALNDEVKHPTLKMNHTEEMAKISALRYRALFNLIIESGLRIEEALGLELDKIIINGNKAEIFVSKTKAKSKRDRRVPIPMYVVEYIKEYRRSLQETPKNKYVFLSRTGNKMTPNVVSKKLCEYTMAAKINKNITNHSLRHTYGSLKLNRDNENIANVSKWMGHSTVEFTIKIYHHTENIIGGTTLEDII